MAQNEFEKFLLGDLDTRTNLQNQINQLQSKLSQMGPNDPNRQALMQQLQGLRASLEREMNKQGATDSSGRLLNAKDVQDQYLDKDYLALKRQQAQDESAQALSTGLKAAKQAQLAGTSGPGDIMSVMSKVENIQRASNEGLANTVRDESLRAKGEALTELGRKQSYATQLTDVERNSILDTLNQQLADMGFAQSQLATLSNALANQPDGLLQQLLKTGTSALVQWGMGQLLPGKK